MITMDDTIIAIWYISLDDTTDWLCAIQEHDDHYEVNYRFRYYEDDKSFDSKDTKSWYAAKIPKSEQTKKEVMDALRQAFTMLKDASDRDEAYELVRGTGSFEDFHKEFINLPFVHAREPTEEEKRGFRDSNKDDETGRQTDSN